VTRRGLQQNIFRRSARRRVLSARRPKSRRRSAGTRNIGGRRRTAGTRNNKRLLMSLRRGTRCIWATDGGRRCRAARVGFLSIEELYTHLHFVELSFFRFAEARSGSAEPDPFPRSQIRVRGVRSGPAESDPVPRSQIQSRGSQSQTERKTRGSLQSARSAKNLSKYR